jgi:hypothetical protein
MTTKSKYTAKDTINKLEKLEKLKNDKVYQDKIKTSKNTLKKGQTNFDEMQEKLKLTQNSLKNKNEEIIRKRVKKIIDLNYSSLEAEAVQILVKSKFITLCKYSYQFNNKIINVARLSFDTARIRKIIADKDLKLKLKVK